MRRWSVSILIAVLLAYAITILVSVLSGGRFVTTSIGYVVGEIVRVSGLSPLLVKGVVIVVTGPFFWAVAKLTRRWWGFASVEAGLDLYLNRYGIIIVSYVALFSLAQYVVSRGAYFDMTGASLKWC